jgi:hypothetical protein
MIECTSALVTTIMCTTDWNVVQLSSRSEDVFNCFHTKCLLFSSFYRGTAKHDIITVGACLQRWRLILASQTQFVFLRLGRFHSPGYLNDQNIRIFANGHQNILFTMSKLQCGAQYIVVGLLGPFPSEKKAVTSEFTLMSCANSSSSQLKRKCPELVSNKKIEHTQSV